MKAYWNVGCSNLPEYCVAVPKVDLPPMNENFAIEHCFWLSWQCRNHCLKLKNEAKALLFHVAICMRCCSFVGANETHRSLQTRDM